MVHTEEFDAYEGDHINNEYNIEGKDSWTNSDMIELQRDFISNVLRYEVDDDNLIESIEKELSDVEKWHIEHDTLDLEVFSL
jgi:hypothetical protein